MTSNTVEAAALATDQPLTQSELDRARMYLDQTKSGLVVAIRNLSDPQWKFKPVPDRWWAAEIVEHVIMVPQRRLHSRRSPAALMTRWTAISGFSPRRRTPNAIPSKCWK